MSGPRTSGLSRSCGGGKHTVLETASIAKDVDSVPPKGGQRGEGTARPQPTTTNSSRGGRAPTQLEGWDAGARLPRLGRRKGGWGRRCGRGQYRHLHGTLTQGGA
jgi:hypothetical protein